MAETPKPSLARFAGAMFTVHHGGAKPLAPRAPAHLGLRRAAEIVEGVAFDLAGKQSPDFISRLIEIAAELDRHARNQPVKPPALDA